MTRIIVLQLTAVAGTIKTLLISPTFGATQSLTQLVLFLKKQLHN